MAVEYIYDVDVYNGNINTWLKKARMFPKKHFTAVNKVKLEQEMVVSRYNLSLSREKNEACI